MLQAHQVAVVPVADTPLFGQPPAEILDPVPHDDIISRIVGDLDEDTTQRDPGARPHLEQRRHRGHPLQGAAADWALNPLPEEHTAALARARAGLADTEEERWDDIKPYVRPHADHVVGE